MYPKLSTFATTLFSSHSRPHFSGSWGNDSTKGFLTCLLENNLPWVEPLEVGESQDEVDEGGGDDKDGQLPAQPGQQIEGLVLLGERPNVVAEGQVLFPHF